ncbi:MAG: N-acetylmuramoyl-L-alanine amidase [Rikenellaceae bacterium]
MRILLDAGHGKDTPGKRSPIWGDGTQLFEWSFNREIVNRIANILKHKDIAYSIITPEDIDVSLSERVKRVNAIASKEPCMLISVHANAGGGTGWEAWTSVGKTTSDAYVREFYNAAHLLLKCPIRVDTLDGDEDKESNFCILKNTSCPAVLTENLFMDTERDCRFIMSEAGKDVIAKLHVSAIEAILKHL